MFKPCRWLVVGVVIFCAGGRIMDWIIHYDDETFVTSSGVAWRDTPSYGVLFVQEINPSGSNLIHMGMDYYFKRDGTIISCGLQALHEHLVLGINAGVMKFGRWSPDDVWNRVHDRIFPSS